MESVAQRLDDIRSRMAAACARAGRKSDSVQLIAVSKTFPADALVEVADAGQDAFGESYMQEAIDKIGLTESLAGRPLAWHFIGPIQSNKCRALAGAFGWAHGVDRLKIAERLSTLRNGDQAPLNVCVQVNVSGEANKGGVPPEQAASLCAAIASLPYLKLRGLMCIPALADNPEVSRASFQELRELHRVIVRSGLVDVVAFDTLSMGMSDDFEIAIEEGATLIRVGSAIFGRRG